MAAELLRLAEEKIRNLCLTKRVRISGFFIDFDGLRSGFVSATQFFRTLYLNLSLKFSPEEEQAFRDRYDVKGNGMINWRLFSNSIEAKFDPNNLQNDPVYQRLVPKEFLGTERSVRPLGDEEEQKLRDLLCRMVSFYSNRGINVRTTYADFDTHHIGVVTESQFYRSFPGPPDVTEQEIYLLIQKYKDPERQGLVNYLNLNHDLLAICQRDALTPASLAGGDSQSSPQLAAVPAADPTVQQIFDRIRIAAHKHGVRVKEFFRDFDKLRAGIITENQFVCGLSLALSKQASLSREEIQKVVEFYRLPDGRVQYRDFCEMIANAFNISELEKKPTQEPVRPPQGALSRVLQPLTTEEEARLEQCLAAISEQVRSRQIMMFQYFKDYDKSKAYTRTVTKSQFGRILHFLNISVEPEDLKLILRKFEEPTSGYMNYPAFVQAVDKEFVGFTMDIAPAELRTTEEKAPPKPLDLSCVDLDALLVRLRHHVLVNRLRVKEYFEDFDQLRSGSIFKKQFARCLSSLGISSLGQVELTPAQLEVLCLQYQDPENSDKVCWKRFMHDLETVFTQPNLEKAPEFKVPAQERFLITKPGTVDWSCASEDHAALVASVMERLRLKVEQRRVLVKPVFQDFDTHNQGLVTRGQFRQCLAMLELQATDHEMIALEAKFTNDYGFNYFAFLNELQPKEPLKHMYVDRQKDIAEANNKKNIPEFFPERDVEGVLTKIKNKVFRERARLYEFMRDYDKLRSGRMQKVTFRRALDLAQLKLTETEMSMIEDRFQSPGERDYVDYLRFCEEIESIFTMQELEKKPLEAPEGYRPAVDWELRELPAEQLDMFQRTVERIAIKVRQHQMQLFPLFEDYDNVHNGTVTRQQFRRTLTELELGSLYTEREFEVLANKFEALNGGKLMINYVAFCDLINELCKFEWRKP